MIFSILTCGLVMGPALIQACIRSEFTVVVAVMATAYTAELVTEIVVYMHACAIAMQNV